MAKDEIFIEDRSGKYYVALESGNVIATGSTQEEAGNRAHRLRPAATVFGDRVSGVSTGGGDKWRVLHYPAI